MTLEDMERERDQIDSLNKYIYYLRLFLNENKISMREEPSKEKMEIIRITLAMIKNKCKFLHYIVSEIEKTPEN